MTIDLNCDMGEGCGNDAVLMQYISSTNIACGYHAGDLETMKRTVDLALGAEVAVGAHPGYNDRENFGRLPMHLSTAEIYDIVSDQIWSLLDVVKAAGTRLNHVKPHGALYNQAATDASIARAIARSVRDIDPGLVLFGLSGSVSINEAKELGLKTASEVFADRTYRSDGTLTPRNEPGAMIESTEDAIEQLIGFVERHVVVSTTGDPIEITAETVCIHGDGPHVTDFARGLRSILDALDISVKAPTH